MSSPTASGSDLEETQALTKAARSLQLLQRTQGPVLAEECVHSCTHMCVQLQQVLLLLICEHPGLN